MMYTCIKCGKSEDLTLNPLVVTHPQCSCGSIMNFKAEHKCATIMRAEWNRYWPDVGVLILPTNGGRDVKLRWYLGPQASEVKANAEFIAAFKRIQNECCERRGISKRTFKQYSAKPEIEVLL